MIERVSSLLLGRRVRAPEGLAEGSVPDDVIFRRGDFVPWLGGLLGRMNGPAAAVTLRRTIVLRSDTRLTPALLAHELAHVRQWGRDPLFPIRYSMATLRHGYHDNPYEVEARVFARAPFATSHHEEAS